MSLETETKESELKEKISRVELNENITTSSDDTIVFEKISDKTIEIDPKEISRKEKLQEFFESKQNIEIKIDDFDLTEEVEQPIQEEKNEKNEKNEKKFNNYEKNSNTTFNNYSENNKKSNKRILPFLLTFIIIILLLLVLSTIFALINSSNNKILDNITVNNIDISSLTEEEAKQKLEKELSKKLSLTYNLTYQDYETTFTPTDIDATFDIDSIIKKAYQIGRNDNIFISNFEIISTLLSTKNLKPELKYNEEKLDTILNNINLDLPGLVTQPSYYINEDNLIITKGTSGVTLHNEKLKDNLISLINSSNQSNNTTITIPVQQTQPSSIDLEKIYSEIHTEPKNAYIVKEPFELHLDEDGVDFAISIEEAKKLLLENNQEYSIPLKYTEAKITIEDLGEDAFPHNLGSYTTRYDESNVNRSTNLKLATKKINGTVLKPGEVFSYNKVVGERTIANGFKEAIVYANGGMEAGLGGGICQISSTLYNSVIFANLEIVERKNHSLPVSYVPLGRDATVAYGSIDFRFKNNRSYPIKIQATASSGVVKISILGIKENTEYNVTFQSQKLQSIAYTTQYVNDSSLAKGKQVVKQAGAYGSKYVTYKIVSLNGSIVEKVLLSTDTYNPQKKIVRVGTGGNSIPSTSNNTSTQTTPNTSTSTPSTSTPSSNITSETQTPNVDITITY